MGNRTGWAFTFLTKAGLIEKAAPKFYKATQLGLEFLKSHPATITVKDLEAIPGFHEAWELGSAKRRQRQQGQATEQGDKLDGHATPQELIEREVGALRADLRSRLIESIIAQTPEFFERLVLDVLVAMGYGGTREDAAEHLGQSGDEGIDGRINQDTLGLDQILVQAKRYRPDRKIDRKEVQAFIGSLSGQGVTKGVFITTSSFQDSAHEFVSRGLNTKVVLVDGEMLIDLMIRHRIGVRVLKTHEIHELDQNYFEDED
jgi:restriction system protein